MADHVSPPLRSSWVVHIYPDERRYKIVCVRGTALQARSWLLVAAQREFVDEHGNPSLGTNHIFTDADKAQRFADAIMDSARTYNKAMQSLQP